jgi:hypothetical protein
VVEGGGGFTRIRIRSTPPGAGGSTVSRSISVWADRAIPAPFRCRETANIAAGRPRGAGAAAPGRPMETVIRTTARAQRPATTPLPSSRGEARTHRDRRGRMIL